MLGQYHVGDPVDVYDEDLRDWVPGLVESTGIHRELGETVVVTTDHTYQGKALKYVVATDGNLIRRSR